MPIKKKIIIKKAEISAEGPWEEEAGKLEKKTNTIWLLESCLVTCLLSHCWKRREEQLSTEQPLWKDYNIGNLKVRIIYAGDAE